MIRNKCSAAWTMLVITDKNLCPFSAMCLPRTVTAIPKPVNELEDLDVMERQAGPHSVGEWAVCSGFLCLMVVQLCLATLLGDKAKWGGEEI